MIIKEPGKYELLRDIKTRKAYSIGTLLAGTVLNIKQIDTEYHNVIGEPLYDWTYWDLPVIKVE
jgi:hypothetical protein